MGLSLKASHLKRYKDVTNLLMKIGQEDVLRGTGLVELFVEGTGTDVSAGREVDGGRSKGGGRRSKGGRLRKFLPAETSAMAKARSKESDIIEEVQRLGPTFVELARLLTKRPDIVPLPYLEALSQIDDHFVPLSFEEADALIEAELGANITRTFKSFEPQPISSGALGQVHRALTLDGTRVVVKIQKPGARESIVDDLESLDEMAEFVDEYTRVGKVFDTHGIVAQLRKVMVAQLDYRQEAHNLRALQRNIRKHELIIVPAPIESLCTTRVLTMREIDGQKISELSTRKLTRFRRAQLAQQVFHSYLQQILEDGFVDADPNPENVLLTPDQRIALLDLGVVARISPSMQDRLLQILGAIDEGRTDQVADLVLNLSERREDFDENGFRKELSELVLVHRDMAIENLEIGRVLQGIAQGSFKYGLALPPEFAILGTALVSLDEIAHIIDPHFDANRFLRETVAEMVKKRMLRTLSPVHLFQNMIETGDLLDRVPIKIGRILDSLAGNNLKITVDAIDEDRLMIGIQKIANRITVGLVLAALIIGAALMMRIETTFRIFGYPGVAMLCFLLAGGTGLFLVLEILVSDHRHRRRG